eukprot:SAG31_NODE_290_length_18324_cov_33.408889_17_plen_46_part_00
MHFKYTLITKFTPDVDESDARMGHPDQYHALNLAKPRFKSFTILV